MICAAKMGAILIFFNFSNPFDFKYNSHFGLIVYVTFGNTHYLSVVCLCVIHCFSQNFKALSNKFPKYIQGDFLSEALWGILI